MGTAALVAGLLVLLVTVPSQTGLLGGHDFLNVALLGLLATVFCMVAVLMSRSRAALTGLALSLLPIALLVYYLATTDG